MKNPSHTADIATKPSWEKLNFLNNSAEILGMKCQICHIQERSNSKAKVFDSDGNTHAFNLCQYHDRELFLIGQIKFLEKYDRPPPVQEKKVKMDGQF